MREQRGAGRRRGRWRWRDRDREVGKEEKREGERRERAEGRKGGRGREKIRKYRNRRKGRREVRWKEARGLAGWGGLQAWEGRPGSGDVSTGSAPCTCVGGWVWAHKPS